MIHLYHGLVTPPPDRVRWLLLIHQLPKEPAYLRVKVSRRLARVGAVALKNSVYVLPKNDSTAEDFQWVRQEIVDAGGEATVVEANVVAGLTDGELEAKFRDAKDAEYAELLREAKALQIEATGRRRRPLSEEERTRLHVEVTRLERKLRDMRTTDFFGASGCEAVRGLLHELRAKAEPPSPAPSGSPPPPPRGRTWVTRAGIHVDRIASAWLIRRFIDREAKFKFVSPKGYVPLDGELRFDMFEAEYSHEGDACTFEVLCARFGVDVPGIRAIAELVHDIDLKDGKFARPEVPGLAAQIAGLALLHRDDDARIARGSELFEELLTYFARKRE
jgi:hypothetical protein